MCLPFVVQSVTLVGEGVNSQKYIIFLVLIALLASDYLSSFFFKLPRKNIQDTNLNLGRFLGFFTFILCTTHLFLMPKIPIIEKYFHQQNDVTLLREEASKLLNVPDYFIYLIQLSSSIIGPISVLILLTNKRYLTSVTLSTFLVFYSHATTAKGPLILTLLFLFLIYFQVFKSSFQKLLLKKIFFASILIFVAIATYAIFCDKTTSPFIKMYSKELDTEIEKSLDTPENQAQGLSYTFGDKYRQMVRTAKYQSSPSLYQSLNYFFYRAFLVPLEVSHRWYNYFTTHSDKIGFYGLTPSSRNSTDFQHPANKVGIWAYVTRFPQQYFNSVRAYASFDADAYARWGIPGVIVITFFICLLRFMFSYLMVPNFYSYLNYQFLLVILSLNLPAGSIFAILIAQGLAFCLLIHILIKYFNNKSLIRPQ